MSSELHKACEENNYDLIKLLVYNSTDINKKDEYSNTPLYIACKNNNEEIIKLLIENGATLNEKNDYDTTCSELIWDLGYKDIIKSYYNASEIIYNDNYDDLEPYLITKTGSIIDVYENKIYENKIIEPIINDSYLQVNLEGKIYLVHILVANTFKPNEDKTLIIKHVDNNILNNDVDNLEWVKYEIDLSHTEYMYKIEFSEIPEFLHYSELYKTCLESGDDFEILKKYYKNNLIINSIEDFIHMLYTLRYWCIEKIPHEVYDYVISNKIIIEIYYNLLEDIFHEVFFLKEFNILFRFDKENLCKESAHRGMINCLKYAYENGYPWTEETCYIASEHGHLDCLKYAHENGCPWDTRTCSYASIDGYLDCLKYAHENGCRWDKKTCWFALRNGQLACLKYAHENGCPLTEDTCSDASKNGHLDCLRYAHENGCPLTEDICSDASKNGHLACLKYAHENGCPWDKKKCLELAKKNNHLECVKYIEDN